MPRWLFKLVQSRGIYTDTKSFSKKTLESDYRFLSQSSFPVTIGKDYNVYEVYFQNGTVYYLICEDTYSYYPMLLPSLLFLIIDNRLSRHWVADSIVQESGLYYELGFSEMDKDHFYSNLVDGEYEEREIFKQCKQLIDLEFPNNEITESASVLDADWLMCPHCIDAWQWPSKLDAQVICPTCLNTFKNPRYVEKIGVQNIVLLRFFTSISPM